MRVPDRIEFSRVERDMNGRRRDCIPALGAYAALKSDRAKLPYERF